MFMQYFFSGRFFSAKKRIKNDKISQFTLQDLKRFIPLACPNGSIPKTVVQMQIWPEDIHNDILGYFTVDTESFRIHAIRVQHVINIVVQHSAGIVCHIVFDANTLDKVFIIEEKFVQVKPRFEKQVKENRTLVEPKPDMHIDIIECRVAKFNVIVWILWTQWFHKKVRCI
jgi:hypothetical protein